MLSHTRLRNKKFKDVTRYLKRHGLIEVRIKGRHHVFKNPKNKRTYAINPIGKEQLAVPKQLIAMTETLQLPDDFWNDL